MITLIFMTGRETFSIRINGRSIVYFDKYGAKDLVKGFNTEELAEYDKAISEEELAEICKRDCAKQGHRFLYKK